MLICWPGGIWDLTPGPEIKPAPPCIEREVLTTGLPEKAPVCLLTFLLDLKHCEFCIIDLDFLFFFSSSFVLFLAVLLSFQGLISPTRDWTWALGSRSMGLRPLDCPWTSNLFILDGDLLASSLCSAIHGNHCICGGLSPRIIPPTSLTQPGLFFFLPPPCCF